MNVIGTVVTTHNHHSPVTSKEVGLGDDWKIPALKTLFSFVGSRVDITGVRLTAVKVPGKKTMVSSAIDVMLVLSLFVSAAICIVFRVCSCAFRCKIKFMMTSFRPL
jgi:hypothetical protein